MILLLFGLVYFSVVLCEPFRKIKTGQERLVSSRDGRKGGLEVRSGAGAGRGLSRPKQSLDEQLKEDIMCRAAGAAGGKIKLLLP